MRIAFICYTLTVLTAMLIAYDPGPAHLRAALLIAGVVAGAAIAFAGRRWGSSVLRWTAAGCALLAAAIGGYFLLTHDWTPVGSAAGAAPLTAGSAKFALIQRLGLWLQARRPALPLPDDVNGNVAAAALVILLPLVLPALMAERRALAGSRVLQTAGRLALALCVLIALVGLVLTGSRGAWLGLCAAAFVAAALWAIARRAPHRFAPCALALGAATVLGAFLIVWAATTLPDVDLLLRTFGRSAPALALDAAGSSALSPAGSSALGPGAGRPQLWRDGLALAGDYIFTGAGLGGTQMVYSTYAMILHVGYITHAHHLFLQIALEQGLPALLAFLALLACAWNSLAQGSQAHLDESILSGVLPAVSAGRSRRMPSVDDLPWRLAAAASLTALVVHGALDAGPFASRLAPVLFIPIGYALALRTRPAGWPAAAPEGILSGVASGTDARSRRMRRPASRVALFAAPALLLLLALLPAPRAAFQANLGALAQTRAELSVYRWPAWPIQDALRRALPAAAQLPGAPAPVDLAPAVARYGAVLILDPANVTANRRLGQIELSQGDYPAAHAHLQAAYAATRAAGLPDQYATRLLLGELLAVEGRPAEAAALWRGLDFTSGQLDGRVWWHEALGEHAAARQIKAAEEMARS